MQRHKQVCICVFARPFLVVFTEPCRRERTCLRQQSVTVVCVQWVATRYSTPDTLNWTLYLIKHYTALKNIPFYKVPASQICTTLFVTKKVKRLDGLQRIWRPDTLQYIGSKRAFTNRRTKQATQLFTYLLTHKLFSSCIRRYLVSRACDWVMPALSAVLLTFSINFVCFSSIYCSQRHASTAAYYWFKYAI